MRFRVGMMVGLLFLLSVAAGVEGRTIRVPEDNQSVRMALLEAVYGDTVLVSPGRYRVQARVRPGVKLLSTDGPDSTTFVEGRWHILKLNSCDIETKVSGFTFEGRGANACFVCTTGAPIIQDNVIRDSWDGISLKRCNAFIKNNVISGCNRGIFADESDAEIVENTLTGNAEAISLVGASPVIAGCEIKGNNRAILIQGHSYPTIGGMLSSANDFIDNSFSVYNAGLRIEGAQFTDRREVAVATHNYWGSLCPDRKRMRGDVMITPWTNAAHDTLLEACPEAEEEGATE
jgi:parallel beta-helix repeat protein